MRFEKPKPSSTPGRELRVGFHGQLAQLDGSFTRIAGVLADQVMPLSELFLQGDPRCVADAVSLAVSAGDANEEIQERGFVLLARESPAMSDLRLLVALLRVSEHLERSGSLLRHVCQTVDQFDPRTYPLAIRERIEELATESADVFKAGIAAWRGKAPDAVREIDQADVRVDQLRDLVLGEAEAASPTDGSLMVIGLIARYYERIADHGVAIAQDAAYVATGTRVPVGTRHRQQPGLE